MSIILSIHFELNTPIFPIPPLYDPKEILNKFAVYLMVIFFTWKFFVQ